MQLNHSKFTSVHSLLAFFRAREKMRDGNSGSTPVTSGDVDSTPASPVDNDLAQSLQNTLDSVLAETVGVSAAIVSPEETWFGASGLANLRANTPVTPSDRFQIGSITKTFVATTVLQLMEEGKLTLEDTLDQWLPGEVVSMIPGGGDVTIHQLLNHTSGISDYLGILLDSGINLFREWQPNELVGLIAAQPLSFTPGTSWQYSNTNYILLGMIVENVTGTSIASEIRSRILEPLKLDNTFFAEAEAIPGGFVSGYWDIDQDGDLDDMSFISLSLVGSAGAMVSNTEDLVDFAKGLFEGDLLEATSLQQMLTFTEAVGSRAFSGYGLGVAQLNTPDDLIYGHNGLTLGYRANLWYLPEEKLVYADLQNTRTINNFIEPLLATWRQDQLNDTGSGDYDLTGTMHDAIANDTADDLLSGGIEQLDRAVIGTSETSAVPGVNFQDASLLNNPPDFASFCDRANFAQTNFVATDVLSSTI